MPRITPAERQRRFDIIERFLAADGEGSAASLNTWRRIGVALEISHDRIRYWWQAQVGEKVRKRGSNEPKHYGTRERMAATQRTCLGADCGRVFPSWGAGNRLCHECRQRVASPFTPGGGGDTGRRIAAVRS